MCYSVDTKIKGVSTLCQEEVMRSVMFYMNKQR